MPTTQPKPTPTADHLRSVAEIDRDIDAIHDDLLSRYPALRRAPKRHYGPTYLAACQRWQAAWDAHPALREQERQLFLGRHAAREAEYKVEAAQARRAEAVERRTVKNRLVQKRKTCPTCGGPDYRAEG